LVAAAVKISLILVAFLGLACTGGPHASGTLTATAVATRETGAALTSTPSIASPTPLATLSPRPLPDDLPTPPGSYILAAEALYGIRPLDITFTVWRDGWLSWGPGVVTTEPDIRDQVGMGFADVANLYKDPCHWQTAGVTNPPVGPSVEDLVDAFAAQADFTASTPTKVSLAGFSGSYVELTLDAGLDFSNCDEGTVHSWVDVNGRSRYYQGPGQIEQFWILDVGGTRLVIEGSFFPEASVANRDDLARIIESIRIASRFPDRGPDGAAPTDP
jgi:hypothetical protein